MQCSQTGVKRPPTTRDEVRVQRISVWCYYTISVYPAQADKQGNFFNKNVQILFDCS